MGNRMELYVPGEAAPLMIRKAAAYGLDARIIGRVETSEGRRVTIKNEYGTFTYEK
jgi:phosphoribosylformylglycinamidine cyclo-ligase